MTKIRMTTIGLFLLVFASESDATLIDRGGGLIYDSDQDVTWMQDAGVSGSFLSWFEALTWADTLVFGGFDDWRLPVTVQPDPSCSTELAPGQWGGTFCTGSEMGYLSNVYGISTAVPGPFTNVGSFDYYSATEYALDTELVWIFNFASGPGGLQGLQSKDGFQAAWAVRDGDVITAAPAPSTLILIGSGLLGWVGCRRRR